MTPTGTASSATRPAADAVRKAAVFVTRPTVVLVHDGCSDATAWAGVGESYDDLVARLAPGQGRARLLRTGAGDELTVPPECFRELVTADLDPELAQVLASLQRPVAERVFTEVPTAAEWRDKPFWALVTGADQALPPAVQRFTAERAGAPVTELREASHAVIVSRSTAVAELIHDVATGR
ncbi:alpha/beta fold hydrolase [Kitasatospora griseola]|uniref:alpha/beta fold hydrolase n=1 Tax=Kitasatospora griseola TaxID=2064 RepID=UPI0038221BFC